MARCNKNFWLNRAIALLVILFQAQFVHSDSGMVNPSDYPSMSSKQLGHFRHIVRLANQLHGEWGMMGTKEPDQEGDDAYRYQLAFMAYALGLAQYHYLPAHRELAQNTFERLVDKMLRREVWGYWENTSQGSKYLNPDMVKLREGWIDPVEKENIMYSGHLLAMVGMYSSLYRSSKYTQPGSLAFHFDPVFRGFGHKKYEYSSIELADLIYRQFEENNWLGVTCEPNAIFVICNQMPILGFRFLDQIHGTEYAKITSDFENAWRRKGWLTEDNSIITAYLVQQDEVWRSPSSAYIDAWTGAMMHAWNRDFVRSLYPIQSKRWVVDLENGLMSVAVGEEAAEVSTSDFGFMAIYASEVGDRATTQALLGYADKYMSPVWEDGSYYYPRKDEFQDDNGNIVFMTRLTGNALLAYARLNVENGLWALYNKPWTSDHLSNPYISGVEYPEVLVTQAHYDASKSALIFTLQGDGDTPRASSVTVNQLDSSKDYLIYKNDVPIAKVHGGIVQPLHEDREAELGFVGNQLSIGFTSINQTSFVVQAAKP